MTFVPFDTFRRCDELRLTPEERKILEAQRAIEAMPPDQRLTDASVLLTIARGKVADYVDGVGV